MKRRLCDDERINPQSKVLKLISDDSSITIFNSLPKDTLFEVFSFLPIQELIQNVSVVNRDLYTLILEGNEDTHSMWNHVCKYQILILRTSTSMKFLQYCRPTSIRIASTPINTIMGHICIIEQFVVKLETTIGSDDKLLLKILKDNFKRKIFPELRHFKSSSYFSIASLKEYFEENTLKHFKRLSISDERVTDINSLEEIDVVSMNESAIELIKKNSTTLQSIIAGIFQIQDYSMISDCISGSNIVSLHLTLMNSESMKPPNLPNLKQLNLSGNMHQISTFFSASHESLNRVVIHENIYTVSIQKNVTPVLQKSIKYFNGGFNSVRFANSILKIVNQGLTQLIIDSVKIDEILDISKFSKLYYLGVSRDLLKINSYNLNLSWLHCKQSNINASTVFSMSNLSELHIDYLDGPMLIEIVKLPLLRELIVDTLQVSFARFTGIMIHLKSPDIQNIVVTDFKKFLEPNEQIHVLPTIPSLKISNLKLQQSCENEPFINWFLYLISTHNVRRIEKFDVTHLGVQFWKELEIDTDFFYSPIKVLIDMLLEYLECTLNEDYLTYSDTWEKDTIESKFRNILENAAKGKQRYIPIEQLIKSVTNHLSKMNTQSISTNKSFHW
jgi:hypothetical protein